MSPVLKSRLPVGSSASRNSGLADQGPGQHHPLLLAPGKLARPVRGAGAQPDFLQPRQRRRRGFRVGNAPDQQRHHHVLQRRELRQQVVNLPDKTDFPVAEARQLGIRQRRQLLRSEVVLYPPWAGPGRPAGAAAWTCRRRIRPPAPVVRPAGPRGSGPRRPPDRSSPDRNLLVRLTARMAISAGINGSLARIPYHYASTAGWMASWAWPVVNVKRVPDQRHGRSVPEPVACR